MGQVALIKDGEVVNVIVVDADTDEQFFELLSDDVEFDQRVDVTGSKHKPQITDILEDREFYPQPHLLFELEHDKKGAVKKVELVYHGPPSRAPKDGTKQKVALVDADTEEAEKHELIFVKGRAEVRPAGTKLYQVEFLDLDDVGTPEQIDLSPPEPPAQ